MRQVIAEKFGPPEVLRVIGAPTPTPGFGQVRVRVTSIGMNHAELMARRGEYRIVSGDPPFTPGLEAGGIIDELGNGVTTRKIGQRVIIGADAPRAKAPAGGGTYRSDYICEADQAIIAPESIGDEQLGAIWLPYLTAWGCLVWKQAIKPGDIVAIPAASSSVALAAAQIVQHKGGVAIGLTSSPDKVESLRALPGCAYDHIIATHDNLDLLPFHEQLKQVTDGHGVDVFFDPVAAGPYLATEIRAMAKNGTIWVYGLLDKSKRLNVQALIRKQGAIRGWMMAELTAAGPKAFEPGYSEVLDAFAAGTYRQHVDRAFKLDDVQEAHRYMESGQHIGKLVLVP